jgi:transposase
MPPAYVKPYVKTQKNDEADAEAICEAVARPNMRLAEVKTIDQQSVLALTEGWRALVRKSPQAVALRANRRRSHAQQRLRPAARQGAAALGCA